MPHKGRQTCYRPRTEQQIDMGGFSADSVAIAGRHAGGDADDEAGVAFLESLQVTEFGEEFALGFFADGAGVDDDDVGGFSGVGDRVAVGLHES